MKINKLKILHISDTHGFHKNLNINTNVDLIIHSGDATNWRDPYKNVVEMENFIYWYSRLDIEFKIYVAGNHDTSIEKGLIKETDFLNAGIVYLQDDYVEVKGRTIYGSPYTPTYGEWSFMKSRNKIHKVWDNIPEFTEVLVTHGPAKGLLDVVNRLNNMLEHAGCSNLRGQINHRLNLLKLHCFGHIHNDDYCTNSGKLTLPNGLLISNASAVEDGKFNGNIINHGNYFEI